MCQAETGGMIMSLGCKGLFSSVLNCCFLESYLSFTQSSDHFTPSAWARWQPLSLYWISESLKLLWGEARRLRARQKPNGIKHTRTHITHTHTHCGTAQYTTVTPNCILISKICEYLLLLQVVIVVMLRNNETENVIYLF